MVTPSNSSFYTDKGEDYEPSDDVVVTPSDVPASSTSPTPSSFFPSGPIYTETE